MCVEVYVHVYIFKVDINTSSGFASVVQWLFENVDRDVPVDELYVINTSVKNDPM